MKCGNLVESKCIACHKTVTVWKQMYQTGGADVMGRELCGYKI